VVAGGTGDRFGGPKQFAELAGRPVAAWSVAAARGVADGIVLVVPDGADGLRAGSPQASDGYGADTVVVGGPTRAASVRAGLAVVPAEAGVIVVHDAARPLAPASLFDEVVSALAGGGADGVVPVLPVTDTLKRVADGVVRSTVGREGLAVVQTPQAFIGAALRAAHAGGGEATDDAGLLESMGATVRCVPGDPRNLKVTHPDDLALAEVLVAAEAR